MGAAIRTLEKNCSHITEIFATTTSFRSKTLASAIKQRGLWIVPPAAKCYVAAAYRLFSLLTQGGGGGRVTWTPDYFLK